MLRTRLFRLRSDSISYPSHLQTHNSYFLSQAFTLTSQNCFFCGCWDSWWWSWLGPSCGGGRNVWGPYRFSSTFRAHRHLHMSPLSHRHHHLRCCHAITRHQDTFDRLRFKRRGGWMLETFQQGHTINSTGTRPKWIDEYQPGKKKNYSPGNDHISHQSRHLLEMMFFFPKLGCLWSFPGG